MATEGPMIHDGAQCVAAANYTNTAGLLGPSGSGQFLAVSLVVSTNRTVIVNPTGTLQSYGILQNKPASGEVADVCIFGITKAVCGTGGSTAGKAQMVITGAGTAAGTIGDWVAGSANPQIGWAIETAVAGQVFTMFFGLTTPKTVT